VRRFSDVNAGAVSASAPVRICDIGGWTDTWFSGHGQVFHIAVEPRVEVQLHAHPIGSLASRVVLDAVNYGDRYAFDLGALPGRHPLLEAAIEEVGLPDDVSVEVSVSCAVPAGCSTGTSAATVVALIGALDALTPGRVTAHEVAAAAHRVETERLGTQSGVQDQLCAAYGGINYIEIDAYPHASVTQLSVPDSTLWELERRLVLLYLGRSHRSSDVHDRVIADSERRGGETRPLEQLRRAAECARDAVSAADFDALGQAMISNTEAQAELHADLVSDDAHAAIAVAAAHDALGWKINGAGGEGGSLTLLCGPDMRRKRQLLRALHDADPRFRVIPTRLSPSGVRIWAT